jgi:hypothetical protein
MLGDRFIVRETGGEVKNLGAGVLPIRVGFGVFLTVAVDA